MLLVYYQINTVKHDPQPAADIRSLRHGLAPICLVFKDKTGASQSFIQFSKIL